jgi:hypothetical protein
MNNYYAAIYFIKAGKKSVEYAWELDLDERYPEEVACELIKSTAEKLIQETSEFLRDMCYAVGDEEYGIEIISKAAYIAHSPYKPPHEDFNQSIEDIKKVIQRWNDAAAKMDDASTDGLTPTEVCENGGIWVPKIKPLEVVVVDISKNAKNEIRGATYEASCMHKPPANETDKQRYVRLSAIGRTDVEIALDEGHPPVCVKCRTDTPKNQCKNCKDYPVLKSEADRIRKVRIRESSSARTKSGHA